MARSPSAPFSGQKVAAFFLNANAVRAENLTAVPALVTTCGPAQETYFTGRSLYAVEPYLRIAETYGWDVYRKTFAAYHAPGFAKPNGDAEKWGVFTTQLSDAAGADLAAVFAAWGVPVPEAVLADCAARHPAAPESLRP